MAAWIGFLIGTVGKVGLAFAMVGIFDGVVRVLSCLSLLVAAVLAVPGECFQKPVATPSCKPIVAPRASTVRDLSLGLTGRARAATNGADQRSNRSPAS